MQHFASANIWIRYSCLLNTAVVSRNLIGSQTCDKLVNDMPCDKLVNHIP